MDLFWQAIAAIASAALRPPALLFGSMLGFGILIPYRLGPSFGDSRMLLAYAFLPMLFVAAPVAMGVPRARESARKLYVWLVAGIVLGLGLWIVFAALALLTMTIAAYPVRPSYPGLAPLLLYAALCAGSCWLAAALSAYLAMLFSPTAARNAMRVGFLLILIGMRFGPGMLSPRMRWYMSGFPSTLLTLVPLLLAAGLTNALRAGVNQTSAVASQ